MADVGNIGNQNSTHGVWARREKVVRDSHTGKTSVVKLWQKLDKDGNGTDIIVLMDDVQLGAFFQAHGREGSEGMARALDSAATSFEEKFGTKLDVWDTQAAGTDLYIRSQALTTKGLEMRGKYEEPQAITTENVMEVNSPIKSKAATKTGSDIKYTTANSSAITEYGNSYFKLTTVDKNISAEHPIVLDGVLKEMPEISISSEWTDGPGAAAANWVKNFVKSDELEIIQFFGNAGDAAFSNITFGDAWTGKVYSKSEVSAITLSFRIYNNDRIGTKRMASAFEWIKVLTALAPLNAGNDFNVANVANALNTAYNNAVDDFKAVKKALTKEGNTEGFMQMVNNINDTVETWVTANAGSQRVTKPMNKDKTGYGAKLFYLHIYPFIFKKAIPVYVSSWSFTPSKETLNETKISMYYDFEVTCELDQVPSLPTMRSIFGI